MAQQKNQDDVQAAVRAELLAMQPMITDAIRSAAFDAVREALSAHEHRRLPPAASPRSAKEWAARRRGEAAALAAQVQALPDEMTDETFAFYAEPIVSRVREAIRRLADAEHIEGNTLMILDHLLETLLNDDLGRAYRAAPVRAAVATILKSLAEAEAVTPALARSSYRALREAGLDPRTPLALDAAAR